MDIEDGVLAMLAVVFGGLLVFVVALIVSAPFVSFQMPGAGEHTGYVTAVEQKGFIWKTWTAYVKTDAQSSQEEAYCVENQSVIGQLQTAQRERKLVTFDYESEMIVGKWRCGSEGDIIVSVK